MATRPLPSWAWLDETLADVGEFVDDPTPLDGGVDGGHDGIDAWLGSDDLEWSSVDPVPADLHDPFGFHPHPFTELRHAFDVAIEGAIEGAVEPATGSVGDLDPATDEIGLRGPTAVDDIGDAAGQGVDRPAIVSHVSDLDTAAIIGADDRPAGDDTEDDEFDDDLGDTAGFLDDADLDGFQDG